MAKTPTVHIQDERFADRVLCGTPWAKVTKAGMPRSDTFPPAVRDEENGSVNAATCYTCLTIWRRMLKKRVTPG